MQRMPKGRQETAGTNQAETWSASLNGRAVALGLRHHAHDLCEHRVAADLVGTNDENFSIEER